MTHEKIFHSAIFSSSIAYDLFQWAVGAHRFRRLVAKQYICSQVGEHILDVGCGTAEILQFLPGVNYTGIDPNQRYIQSARSRYAGRHVTFRCASVSDLHSGQLLRFQKALALSMLHHLDDAEAQHLCRLLVELMQPGGQFIAIDPCLTESQSRIARFIINSDRGSYVRSSEEYRALVQPFFSHVQSEIRQDLLHIPYTHHIMICKA